MLENPHTYVEDEEARADRGRYWFNLLKIVLCVACLLYLAKLAIHEARADEAKVTFSATDQNGNIVRLVDEPCANTPEWLGLRRAEMRYEGIDYLACWLAVGGAVLVLDSNGDATPLPMQAFTKNETL